MIHISTTTTTTAINATNIIRIAVHHFILNPVSLAKFSRTLRQGLGETSNEALNARRCCVFKIVRGRLGPRRPSIFGCIRLDTGKRREILKREEQRFQKSSLMNIRKLHPKNVCCNRPKCYEQEPHDNGDNAVVMDAELVDEQEAESDDNDDSLLDDREADVTDAGDNGHIVSIVVVLVPAVIRLAEHAKGFKACWCCRCNESCANVDTQEVVDDDAADAGDNEDDGGGSGSQGFVVDLFPFVLLLLLLLPMLLWLLQLPLTSVDVDIL
uniref:Uncharacterized protein n=1 Tax=Glossina palpalis gambiensis TaxID=67801 RepID=A0A1B0BXP0_9MUSC